MAQSGRCVSLTILGGWRKEGLLPPLASQRLETGKGRAYYWEQHDIVPHAFATYDFLRKYGRVDIALWMLWLSGFSVPLRQFRRAWVFRGAGRMLWYARPPTPQPLPQDCPHELELPLMQGQRRATGLLLETVLAFAGTLVPDDGDGGAIITVIERALGWGSRTNGSATQENNRAAENLWLVVRVMTKALEASDLVSTTSDADLRQAQHYVLLVGALLQRGENVLLKDRQEWGWPPWLAERMAAPVFLLILVLLRSGHKPVLDEIAKKLKKRAPRNVRSPAQPAYSGI